MSGVAKRFTEFFVVKHERAGNSKANSVRLSGQTAAVGIYDHVKLARRAGCGEWAIDNIAAPL